MIHANYTRPQPHSLLIETMQIKTISNELDYENLIAIGDIHGLWTMLTIRLEQHPAEFRNSIFLQVGDFNMGYLSGQKTVKELKQLQRFLGNRNCYFYIIRGNHDNPNYFRGIDFLNEYGLKTEALEIGNLLKTELDRIILIEDFTLFKLHNVNIFCVGGGISLNRNSLLVNYNWWHDEKIDYINLDELVIPEKIDICATHVCPLHFHPPMITLDNLVNFTVERQGLLDELYEERIWLNKLWEKIKPDKWVYGHFHFNHISQYENTKTCLITEMGHEDQNYYNFHQLN